MMRLFLAVIAYILLSDNTALSNGNEVSREQAVEIAQQQFLNVKLDPSRYEVHVDKQNTAWQTQMPLWRESSSEVDRKMFRRYSSILKGRSYWAFFFLRKSVDGRYPKDARAIVIVDKENGKTLVFIPGG